MDAEQAKDGISVAAGLDDLRRPARAGRAARGRLRWRRPELHLPAADPRRPSTWTRPRRLCDYLATLGVGAVYLSPLLPSAHGSDHGYDVVRFDTVDPQRGGLAGWHRTARRRPGARPAASWSTSCPNHIGVADAAENPAWWDVLRAGQRSPYARWFDIDWAARPAAAAGARRRLRRRRSSTSSARSSELRYFEHRFPIAPGTGPERATTGRGRARPAALRAGQLPPGRHRAELPPVLRRHHPGRPAGRGPGGLRRHPRPDRCAGCATDGIDGLRIDHPDGLADPAGYLRRLRELAGAGRVDHGGEDPRAGRGAAGGLAGGRHHRLRRAGRGRRGVFVDPAAEAAARPALPRAHRRRATTCRARRAAASAWSATTILRAEVPPAGAGSCPACRTRPTAALTELLVALPGLPLLPAGRRRATWPQADRAGPRSAARNWPTPIARARPPAGRPGRRAGRAGSSRPPARSWPRASRTPPTTATTGSSR